MSTPEEAFLERLRATFRVEAAEHVQAMSAGLLELEKLPSDDKKAAQIEIVFRHAHSLKGAARATNFSTIESICQSLESIFAAWKRRAIELVPGSFDVLHGAVDLIAKLTASDHSPSAEQTRAVAELTAQLNQIPVAEPVLLEQPSPPTPTRPIAPAATPPPERKSEAALSGSKPTVAASPVRAGLTDTIRISTAKLDRLLLEAEEMLAAKQSATQRATELRELEPLFVEWSGQWTKLQPRLRALRNESAREVVEFLDWNFGHMKSLENRLRSLTKAAIQDRHKVSQRVDELLADSKTLIMLPFSTLADILPKLVRDLGREQGKEVNLVVRGGEVEMDKRILEQMKDPLIHLVRNALDHGIEKPEDRERRGKPRRATLAVSVAPLDGNRAEIVVEDDGCGIDVERVKEAAVRRGLLAAEDAAALDERKALDLVFQSDVSTSPLVTEISGRGLGLAIAREQTEKLGGRASVQRRQPVGTVFRLSLPVTLATFRGILVATGGQVVVIPTARVERVARVRRELVKTVENRETIFLEGRAVALVRLDEVLELPRRDADGASGFFQVVVVGSGDEQIAFQVDHVLHDEEVLVKSFSRPLVRVRNIAGATVLTSGKLAPVINVADIVKSARRAGAVSRMPQPATKAPAETRRRSILLAEDSITSRMLLKGILESAGYRVTTAVDGVEAITLLRTEDFDVVVSDIEMPRMNGFDLTAQIRSDKKLADKPVVLVTALASPADRERGVDVGANAYIVKSSFDQSNLLSVLRRLA